MTTPPKASVYRTSRSQSPLQEERLASMKASRDAQPRPAPKSEGEDLLSGIGIEDGFGDMVFGDAARSDPPTKTASAEPSADFAAKVEAVKQEGLTARQLRLAQRIAAMHSVSAKTGEEAVVMLRDMGIDPLHRSLVSKIVAQTGTQDKSSALANQIAVHRDRLPQTGDGTSNLPSTRVELPSREALSEEKRAAEIMAIQKDIAKRRRRRLSMLTLRLFFLVALPTILAGYYYYAVATPLYGTKSQFLIQQADSGGGGGLGGLFSGTQLATNPDSVSVQSYLTSRDAMQRLDKDLGFKSAFQDPSVDPLLRLAPDASNEAAYKIYKDSVLIGYDPTEGVINMEVIAPDARLSQDFSVALIQYAEGQVDQMTSRLRGDQMQGATQSYEEAEQKMLAAQQRVQDLQQRLGVLDPTAEGGAVLAQVSALEGELTKKKLELGQLESNRMPNQSRVDGVQGDISRLEQMIIDTRAKMTEGNDMRTSLAAISGELRIAETDLLTRQTLLGAAAEQLEAARIDANKQVRYLSLSVAPIPPDEPTYPRAFSNTLVAFLIFGGIYLMLSLTISILREQVSS